MFSWFIQAGPSLNLCLRVFSSTFTFICAVIEVSSKEWFSICKNIFVWAIIYAIWQFMRSKFHFLKSQLAPLIRDMKNLWATPNKYESNCSLAQLTGNIVCHLDKEKKKRKTKVAFVNTIVCSSYSFVPHNFLSTIFFPGAKFEFSMLSRECKIAECIQWNF